MEWLPKLFNNTTDKGSYFEQQAQEYLRSQGLVPICKNFNCRYGELDLIMRDGDIVVFIEVKYRRTDAFGGAINALPKSKQAKIQRTIYYYLKQNSLGNCPVRVDFVAINGQAPHQFTWIKSVF
jgi:putative endonuclease